MEHGSEMVCRRHCLRPYRCWRPLLYRTVIALFVGISILWAVVVHLEPETSGQNCTREEPRVTEEDILERQIVRKKFLSTGQNSTREEPRVTEEDILGRQIVRKKFLQSACEALNYTGLTEGLHTKCAQIFVDHQRKFIYCLINKVSSSSMKKALVNGTGLMNLTESAMNINDLKFLSKFGLKSTCVIKDTVAKKNLKDYFKFMIVRHPLKRLLSAYRDKFLGTHRDNINRFQKGMGTKIVKKYRCKPSTESLQKGHDVTFEEFLHYVVDTKSKPDSHWQSYWDSCHPCENSFDFIAYMETMEDVSYILRKVSRRPVPLPKNKRIGKTDEVFKQSYGSIPEWLMEAVIKQFEKDFVIFDYDPYIYKTFETDQTKQ